MFRIAQTRRTIRGLNARLGEPQGQLFSSFYSFWDSLLLSLLESQRQDTKLHNAIAKSLIEVEGLSCLAEVGIRIVYLG
jgi:hypothetical protein